MKQQLPIRRKRNRTARELAEATGLSVRTIQGYIAQERSEYESEAEARRNKVAELRNQGLKWKVIAEEMGVSVDAAAALYQRYKRMQKAKQMEIDL